VTNHVTTSQGSIRSTTTSSGAHGVAVKGPNDEITRVASDADNNVYASHDGNVYKKDENGDWSKYENGDWSTVESPSGAQPKATTRPTGETAAATGTKETAGTASRPSPGITQPKATTRPTDEKPAATATPKTASGMSRQVPSNVPKEVQADAASRHRGEQRTAKATQRTGQGRLQRGSSGRHRR
jgi:hypothetical protein